MPSSLPSPTDPAGPRVEIALVPFHHGELPADHPDLQPFLQAGWTIRRADLRLVEGGQLKHLVVLHRAPLDAQTTRRQPLLPTGSPSTTSGTPTALAS